MEKPYVVFFKYEHKSLSGNGSTLGKLPGANMSGPRSKCTISVANMRVCTYHPETHGVACCMNTRYHRHNFVHLIFVESAASESLRGVRFQRVKHADADKCACEGSGVL